MLLKEKDDKHKKMVYASIYNFIYICYRVGWLAGAELQLLIIRCRFESVEGQLPRSSCSCLHDGLQVLPCGAQVKMKA